MKLTPKKGWLDFFLASIIQLNLIETGLGVEFAERGDNQRLGRPLRFQIWSVGRHWFWIWQRANLNEDEVSWFCIKEQKNVSKE